MKISDANPIQFYAPNAPTYNESESAYIDKYKFYQEFNCDDTIDLQFIDDVHASVLKSITLPSIGKWLNRPSGTLPLSNFRAWMNLHTPGYVPPSDTYTGTTYSQEWNWIYNSGISADVIATIGNNIAIGPWQTKKWYSLYQFQIGANYSFAYDFSSKFGFYGSPAATFQIQILDSSLNILASKDVAYPAQSSNSGDPRTHSIGTYNFVAPAGAFAVGIIVKSPQGTTGQPYTIHDFVTNTTSGHPWTITVGPDTASVNLPGNMLANHAFSDFLYTPYNFIPGRLYNITLAYTRTVNTAHGSPLQTKLIVADSGFVSQFSTVQNAVSGANTISIEFTATSTCVNLMFYHDSGSDVTLSLAANAATGTINGDESYTLSFRDDNDVEITSLPFISSDAGSVGYLNEITFVPSANSLCERCAKLKIIQDSTSAEIYRSDCVNFTQDVTPGVQIFYKSVRNFAGLIYTPNSNYFSIRIPSIFYHDDSTTESKALPLSNSKVVELYATLQKTKKWSILDLPYYMHDKIKLILMHAVSGSVKINGVEWIVEVPYAYSGSDPETYPMRTAEIVLTRKNYSRRNII